MILSYNIEKAREFNRPTYISFVDFPKAFDSVKRAKLWKTLLEMGTPKDLVHLLRRLCETKTTPVRADDIFSRNSHLGAGFHQGCTISPILVNMYKER